MTELTQERVEQILKACRKQKFYVKSLSETREEIFSQMASLPGANLDKPRVSTSNVSDIGAKVEAAQEKLRALDEKVTDALAMLSALREDAMGAINLCDTSIQKAVLTDYYVLGFEWEKVADRVGYSTQGIYKVRLAAIWAIARNAYNKSAAKSVE